MSVKTKAVISIVLNTLMTLITIGIVISYFFTKNFLIKTNQDIFTYFTTDSNLLACIAAIVMVVFDIQILRGKRTIIPKPAIIFKFVSVVAVKIRLSFSSVVTVAPQLAEASSCVSVTPAAAVGSMPEVQKPESPR